MTTFRMDQVQKFINHFNTLETFNRDFLDPDKKMKPHPLFDTVLCNDWYPRIKEYPDIVSEKLQSHYLKLSNILLHMPLIQLHPF